MIKDLKLGLKMMKYGIQFKQMCFFAILFLIVGLAFIIVGKPEQIMLGMLYLMMCFSYFIQPIISTSISSCVASSGVKKRMFLNVPVVINGLGGVIGFVLGLVAITIKYYVIGSTASSSELVATIIISGVMSMAIQVYMLVSFKKFFASLIIFFAIFFPLYFSSNMIVNRLSFITFPVWVAAIAGLVLVILGTGISYGVGKLMYKKDIDSWYYKRTIANAMK